MSKTQSKRRQRAMFEEHTYSVVTEECVGVVEQSLRPDQGENWAEMSAAPADGESSLCSAAGTPAAPHHHNKKMKLNDSPEAVIVDCEVPMEGMITAELPADVAHSPVRPLNEPGSDASTSAMAPPPSHATEHVDGAVPPKGTTTTDEPAANDARPGVIEEGLLSDTLSAGPSRPARRRLDFPTSPKEARLSLAKQYEWFVALLKQHGRELEPLFKEGRHRPYITVRGDSPLYTKLITEGFLDTVMVQNIAEKQHTVIIHNVPLYMNVNLIETPENFMSIKRRYAGNAPRPQLLGVVVGQVPDEVHLLGVGRKRVEPYTAEPDLCRHCSRWGHQEWRCRSAPRCRYCAGTHKSSVCLKKIQDGTPIPPRCCNCGNNHNANSHTCPMKPKPYREQVSEHTQQGRPRLVYRPATAPQYSAWANGAPSSTQFPPLSGGPTPNAPAASTATPVPQRTPATAPQPRASSPPTPAVTPPNADEQQPVLQQILSAVQKLTTTMTSVKEVLATTIARVTTLEQQQRQQQVPTSPPEHETKPVPPPALTSAETSNCALQSDDDSMEDDSGDNDSTSEGTLPPSFETTTAVKTDAAKGRDRQRRRHRHRSPPPTPAPPQWESTLQVLLGQFAALTQQVTELQRQIGPLIEQQHPHHGK